MGIHGEFFNLQMFLTWLLRGVLHSGLILLVVLYGFTGDFLGLLVMGSWAYWTCIAVANVKLLLAQVWLDWSVLLALGSTLLFIPVLYVYSWNWVAGEVNEEIVGVASALFCSSTHWAALALVVCIVACSELTVRDLKKRFAPSALDLLADVEASDADFIVNLTTDVASGWAERSGGLGSPECGTKHSVVVPWTVVGDLC